MNDESISSPIERYTAIDAHKHYVMVGGMNSRQEIVLPWCAPGGRTDALPGHPPGVHPGTGVKLITGNPLQK